jgi:hypothetical protein
VADRKQRDVGTDVAQSIEKEDHAKEKEQVIVSGDHVLGAKIHKREQSALFHPRSVGGRHRMRV